MHFNSKIKLFGAKSILLYSFVFQQGDVGDTGHIGLPGEKGATGEHGIQGSPGPRGPSVWSFIQLLEFLCNNEVLFLWKPYCAMQWSFGFFMKIYFTFNWKWLTETLKWYIYAHNWAKLEFYESKT